MLHSVRFPGESERYRQARNELLQAELRLRQHLEEVAGQRRALPLGGELENQYVFEEGKPDLDESQTVTRVRLSELFVHISPRWPERHRVACDAGDQLRCRSQVPNPTDPRVRQAARLAQPPAVVV